ncbi:MAG: DUF6084 family protein [Bryobacteraceae bacterium]|jgi:hypothetical protein
MPNLAFHVDGAEAVPFAAQPLLALKLHVQNANPDETIHTVTLRTQIQIEANRRQYDTGDKKLLRDLFDQPERWSQTLRPMLWTHATVVIPSFQGETVVDVQVPCTFDFNVAATKYFHAVSEGDIPLNLLFSGSVFYLDPAGALQVSPISWNSEARYRLPVRTWREMMEFYYPNSAWLCLRRDVFEHLYDYKVQQAIPTWEQTLETLLAVERKQVPS